MSKVLVTYATKYGSTKDAADTIGSALREKGLEVDVKAVKEVASLDGYAAVVFGSPLYVGQILKPAGAFLDRNHFELEKVPVAVFALGPLRPTDDIGESRGELSRALAKWPWFKPAVAEVFIGKYDPDALKFPDSLVKIIPATPLKGVPALDHRDPEAMKAWAATLPEKLQVAT